MIKWFTKCDCCGKFKIWLIEFKIPNKYYPYAFQLKKLCSKCEKKDVEEEITEHDGLVHYNPILNATDKTICGKPSGNRLVTSSTSLSSVTCEQCKEKVSQNPSKRKW